MELIDLAIRSAGAEKKNNSVDAAADSTSQRSCTSAEDAQREYLEQLASVDFIESTRKEAVSFVDLALETLDVEVAKLSSVRLLKAAVALAELEATEETKATKKAGKDGSSAEPMDAKKKSKGKAAALKKAAREAERAADEAAREAKLANDKASAAAAKADKLAGTQRPLRISQLRQRSQEAAAERAELGEDAEKVLVLDVQTTKAAEAVKEDQAASEQEEDEEEEVVEAEKWLQPWRSNGVGSGGGRRELVHDSYIPFRSCDCLAIDGSGDRVVSTGMDGTSIEVISASRGGACVRSFSGHTDLVCCVAIKGDVVASAGRDRTIRLWSLRTGECKMMLVRSTEGSGAQIYGLALRRGGTLLSGEGSAKSGCGRVWDVRSGEELCVFAAHTAPVWSVAMSARHELGSADVAMTASSDFTAKVWPLDLSCQGDAGGKIEPLAVLQHPTWVFSVSIESEVAATACGDKRVRLWSLATFDCMRTLMHDTPGMQASAILSVRLCGGVLASGGEDKTVKLWSLANEGECVATLNHGDVVRGIAISRKGFVVSVGGDGKKLILWRPKVASAGDLATGLLKGKIR